MEQYCKYYGKVVGNKDKAEDFLKFWTTEYDYTVVDLEAVDPKKRYKLYPEHEHFCDILEFKVEETKELEDNNVEIVFSGYSRDSLLDSISEYGIIGCIRKEKPDSKFIFLEEWIFENIDMHVLVCSTILRISETEKFEGIYGQVFEETDYFFKGELSNREEIENFIEKLKKAKTEYTSTFLDPGSKDLPFTVYASNAEWIDFGGSDYWFCLD